MPLNKPVRRKLHHTRQVQCQGFEREDGLWDIEAHMTDIKTHSIDNTERGYVGAGEPFHDMWMRLTIDKTMKIHQVEAEVDASPFRHCPGIAGNFRQLKGTRIGPGWHRMTRQMFSGIQGCTHLHELLTPLATTALQTIWPILAEGLTVEKVTEKMLDSCHGWSSQSEFVRQHVPHLYVETDNTQTNTSEA